VTSTSVCQRESQFCPGGWILLDGHCYLFVQNALNWADAEEDCNNKGGHLTSVHSAEENTFIRNLQPRGTIWIGGTDAAIEVVIHIHTLCA
jgi:hypothetical protein